MRLATLLLTASIVMSGCTHLEEVRTGRLAAELQPTGELASRARGCKAPTGTENLNSIEEYAGANTRYWAAYVEFDDEGWLYRRDQQPDQLQALQARMQKDLHDDSLNGTDFVVMAFVHGWHHNAHDADCNVQEFAQCSTLRTSAMPR